MKMTFKILYLCIVSLIIMNGSCGGKVEGQAWINTINYCLFDVRFVIDIRMDNESVVYDTIVYESSFLEGKETEIVMLAHDIGFLDRCEAFTLSRDIQVSAGDISSQVLTVIYSGSIREGQVLSLVVDDDDFN